MRSALKGELSKFLQSRNLLISWSCRAISEFPRDLYSLVIGLTIPMTTASAKRSFSKLKVIKIICEMEWYRRLHGLALLSVDQNAAIQLNSAKLMISLQRWRQIKKKCLKIISWIILQKFRVGVDESFILFLLTQNYLRSFVYIFKYHIHPRRETG